MIVNWQGKDWIRMGECNRCGECCLFGWKTPCPNAETHLDNTVTCKAYNQRGTDDPSILETCGIHTSACIEFPANPGDLMPVTVRNRCSYYFVECPKVLLACSTFEGKAYCFDRWVAAVKALDYPNLTVLMVDNSDTPDYANRIKAVHLDLEGWPEKRMAETNEYIRKLFLDGDYTWWFNLESDVIVPPDTLKLLLAHAREADWVGCSYRSRDKSHCVSSFGCSIFSRRIMEETTFGGIQRGQSVDGYWWGHLVEPTKRYRVVELYDYLDIEHA